MKRNWLKAVTLSLLAWTSMAQATGTVTTRSAGASMEIGLRIVESCAIQTTTGANTKASVTCEHGAPYSIQANPVQAEGPVLIVSF